MNVLMGTRQFKMMIDEELIARLKTAADKTGRDSAQHLAEEILTFYLPVYTTVFEATRRAITHQSNSQAERSVVFRPSNQEPFTLPLGNPADEQQERDDISRQLEDGLPVAARSQRTIQAAKPRDTIHTQAKRRKTP